jgi:hypothetical protein
MSREYRYECKFCGAKFVNEDRYIKHRCKQMDRDEEFRTPIGQAAWIYYQQWMKAYRRQVPRAQSFLHSNFYKSFIKFANFTKSVNMPDTETFIWLMKERDISPTIWTHDKVYALYLEHLDRKATARKQAEVTVNTLFDVAEAANCSVGEIFEVLSPSEIIQLMRQRRLSPWVLLHSKKFLTFLTSRVTPEEYIIIESIIRPSCWVEKFQKHPNDVVMIKKYVAELNI